MTDKAARRSMAAGALAPTTQLRTHADSSSVSRSVGRKTICDLIKTRARHHTIFPSSPAEPRGAASGISGRLLCARLRFILTPEPAEEAGRRRGQGKIGHRVRCCEPCLRICWVPVRHHGCARHGVCRIHELPRAMPEEAAQRDKRAEQKAKCARDRTYEHSGS